MATFFAVLTWSRTEIFQTKEAALLEHGDGVPIYEIEAETEQEAEDRAINLSCDLADRHGWDL